MPSETVAVGDKMAVSIGQVGQVGLSDQDGGIKREEYKEDENPFVASDAINKPDSLIGGFKKDKDVNLDMTKALVGLEVILSPPSKAFPTRITVEGFDGDYGAIEFGNEEASLRDTFEGFNDAFGGGLVASEFVGTTKVVKREGLGGLELLQIESNRALLVYCLLHE